jgi:hypothetical protein
MDYYYIIDVLLFEFLMYLIITSLLHILDYRYRVQFSLV